MSLDAAAPPSRVSRGAFAPLARLWRLRIGEDRLKLIVTVLGAVFASYVAMCAKMLIAGTTAYGFGDFYALWTSAVVAHDGQPLLNYDADALHQRQVAMGMNPHGYNPFPYPPTFLLMLGPFGGLSLPIAFALFMIPSLGLYLWAMTGGRARDWRWYAGALAAPATGITLISGQSGFLSGALMIGGLRLAASRPVLSGVLFGLLTFKPQLGVLVPVALIAAGLWRTAAAATATALVGFAVSGCFLGFGAWTLWLGSIVDYAARFPPVVDLMPTIFANARMLGASPALAWAAQALVSAPVAYVVWQVFRREGASERAGALLIIGTFLATPHAFNYDMPMTAAALTACLIARYDEARSIELGELVALSLMFVLPFAQLAARSSLPPFSWAPLSLMFVLLAFGAPKSPLRGG